MSCNLQKVCYKILNEYFGDIVARVGDALFQKGLNPLKVICTHSKLPYSKVSEALAVLVQHNLVTWEEWRPQTPGYTLLHDRILLILRFPRYVYLVREQFGEEGEMVVDVLLKEGQATASSIIITSCTKLYEAATDESAVAKGNLEQKHVVVRNHLLKLIENEFIQRCPSPQDPKVPVPVLSIKEDQLYSLPSELLDLKALQQEIQLRRAGDTKPAVTHPDAQIYWRVNYDRFHIEFRDSEIRNCVVRRVDPLAGECLGAMLKVSYTRSDPWASSMNVVTASEIRDHLKDLKYLDQYLKILEDDSGGCVQKVGDAGGGQYRLNMANAYETMTHALIDNIVQERFGSKAARVFRLIRKHRMMEQDQIGEISMIGKKEANLLSYRLLHDNFLRIHEQRKTLAPSPANKIIYLFHVDMNSVVRMILECCYKGLYNLMVQREMRSNDNRRLLEKRTRVDTIVENLKQSGGSEEQIQEVEEMVTPSERSLVEQVLATQDKLFDAETGLDDTIFILQMFLYYQMQKD
ncbi:DNA-directed RNA polymerase III subunit RPC3-like [Penaeus japonicus]|uniref:DNA-directed RNA polymerase III subunit RPC3-like n=1 Tax=Penaeus japonicus TaxID=27405 RepID=UPI001C716F72|nr:DNA-directed RNA polymerase III subunit RPC3-like [Penaeus japonicus]